MIKQTEVLGQPAMWLRAPDGAEVTVLLQGGQLVSWIPAGDQERFYLSPSAVAGPGNAVRGGIPVCFPQFSQRGPLPRHGLLRERTWQWVDGAQRGDVMIGVLRTTDDEATRALWPHKFEAELSFSFSGLQLEVELAITNTGDPETDQPFEFNATLHSYVRVDDITRARLAGLYAVRYLDQLTGLSQPQEMDPFSFVGEIDRIYFDTHQLNKGPLTLATAMGRMSIDNIGFEDVVVWNPGPVKAAGLADLPDGDWQRFLCVEAAAIGAPITLAPGQEWVGRQDFEV